MASEFRVFTIPGLEANVALTTQQFYCVKMNTTDKEIVLCDTDGEVILGVLQNKPQAANDAAEVMAFGVTKLEAGETLTAGDFWGTNTSGTGRKVEHTNTGADLQDYAAGVVIVGAASGELATVTVGFPTFQVSAS